MLHGLNDETIFCQLEKLPKHDRTRRIERNLKSLLLKLKISNQITEDFYKHVRPTGSEMPRMYGLLKVHKEGTPLRPNLAMINLAQHSLAKQL